MKAPFTNEEDFERNRSNNRGRAADDEVEELSFEDDPPAHIGDPLQDEQLSEQLPDARQRSGGLTGGETPDQSVTDDDLSPETLFEEEGYEVPAEPPADKNLRNADGSEIGGGTGLDEAELAQIEHPES